jgi:FAD/FMN-containing dehydrogenase
VNTNVAEAVVGLHSEVGPDGIPAVRPSTVEEVAELVSWARQQRMPLWPRSSAVPRHHGHPDGPGVAVDMSSMREVRMVDRRNRVALFEAGVTFGQLAEALRAEGLRPVMPLCPRRGKSALSAYLEREATILPAFQWDLSDPLLCLEVAYGTGDVFRTGSAAGPGSLEEQWSSGDMQKGPMGPGHADWMRIVQGGQGTIAVATWCSAKAEVLPSIETAHVVASDTLTPLVECAYRLLRRNAVDVCCIVDAHAFVDLLAVADAERAEATRRARPWNLVVSVSGGTELPRRRHDLYTRVLRREVREAGARLVDPPTGSPESLLELLRNPSEEPYWKDRRLGASREVFFQTTLDAAGDFVRSFHEHAARAAIGPDRVGVHLQPQLGGRVAHLELLLAHEPGGDQEAATEAFASSVATPLVAEGAFFSRPYGAWSEPALASSGSRDVLERAKTIFDPDRILAPGRLGLKGNPDGYHR